jgi:meiotic recombination protein REC8
VAAQGFLHLLTLVSRGLLGVEQERAFGGIEMRVL